MKRALPIAVASLVARRRVARSDRRRPSFQVDPLWPKPLPNHWLLGSVTGVAVDAQDHIWIVHRGYDSMTRADRDRRGHDAEDRRTSAACRRRRCSSSTRRATSSATGAGPATGTNGRSRPAASPSTRRNVWITAAGPPEIPGIRTPPRRARAGGAAAAPRPSAAPAAAATAGRPGAADGGARGTAEAAGRARAQVLAHRRVPAADRQGRRARRQRQHHGAQPAAGVDVDAAANEVYVADGFATTASSCSTPPPAPTSGSWSGSRRRAFETRRAARRSRRTARSTSAIAATTASRCSTRTARS